MLLVCATDNKVEDVSFGSLHTEAVMQVQAMLYSFHRNPHRWTAHTPTHTITEGMLRVSPCGTGQ